MNKKTGGKAGGGRDEDVGIQTGLGMSLSKGTAQVEEFGDKFRSLDGSDTCRGGLVSLLDKEC